VNGVPAPEFDTFAWGWGGDPYDPGALLGLITSSEIGNSSDSFYSNPEYDRLFNEQTGEFDQEKRKEIIRRMVAIAQRDLPYLVLTDDPNLQAYRTDSIGDVERVCPEGDGDIICEQFAYAPLVTLDAGGGGSDDGGIGTGIIVLIALAVLGLVAFLIVRMRRRRGGRGPVELET
jgi:peptide/nickel transport system substrate-binding protein